MFHISLPLHYRYIRVLYLCKVPLAPRAAVLTVRPVGTHAPRSSVIALTILAVGACIRALTKLHYLQGDTARTDIHNVFACMRKYIMTAACGSFTVAYVWMTPTAT